jgi:hypothetical protein
MKFYVRHIKQYSVLTLAQGGDICHSAPPEHATAATRPILTQSGKHSEQRAEQQRELIVGYAVCMGRHCTNDNAMLRALHATMP